MGLIIKDKANIKKYSEEEVLNKVFLGDALEVLKKLPSEFVDLVFMDPPYFLQPPTAFFVLEE